MPNKTPAQIAKMRADLATLDVRLVTLLTERITLGARIAAEVPDNEKAAPSPRHIPESAINAPRSIQHIFRMIGMVTRRAAQGPPP
jgi:chorismate mutase